MYLQTRKKPKDIKTKAARSVAEIKKRLKEKEQRKDNSLPEVSLLHFQFFEALKNTLLLDIVNVPDTSISWENEMKTLNY